MKWIGMFVGIAALVAPVASASAQADVLQVIPGDAVGFALVNRVGQTNDKIAALARRLKMELPGNPLEMARSALGLEKGLADKGTLAIAAFGGKGENDDPRPVLFVPVTDYKAFVDQLQPKAAQDGITPVTFKDGKSMLAGKKGTYAILAEPENRAALMHVLKSSQGLGQFSERMTAWLAENDVAGMWTPHGIKFVGTQLRKGIAEAKQNFGALPIDPEPIAKFFDAADNFVKSAQSDVSYAGAGLRIDDAGSMHLTVQAQFLKGSGFASAGGAVKAPPGGPVAGIPSGPFVLALGGALPENAMQAMMRLNMQMMKASGQNIPAESMKKLEDAYTTMMKGVGAMGFVLQTGKENQPLFANMAVVIHTDDAGAYLASYEKSILATNGLLKDLNLPLVPTYEVKKMTVGGKPGLQISMDFGQALPDEFQRIFKSMFGPDGKMTVTAAVRDDKSLLMRYTGAEGLQELLARQDKGLAGDAGVIEVAKALPAGSQWALYLSPKGTTEFASNMLKTFLPIPLNVPQFPATPPIGVGARISAEGFELHTVIPAGVVDSVGEYVEKIKRMFRGEI